MTADNARADALQLEALLLARTYLYTLLHKTFGGEPDDALLDVLCAPATRDVADEYARGDRTMAGLVTFLDSLGEVDRAELLDGARDEYMRVFVGPAVLPASPYEGPWRTKDPASFSENSVVVRGVYHGAGLQAAREQRVPDDHVALLLHFAAMRAKAALEAFRAGDAAGCAAALRDQRAFAAGHLANWLPDYAVALRRSKTAVLYPQMMEAAAAFVQADLVFADEAAFYLESAVERAEDAPSPRAGDAPNAPFADADAALDALAALRLRFLDENELAPLS